MVRRIRDQAVLDGEQRGARHPTAAAAILDEKAAISLLSDRVWQQKKNATPGRFNYWFWRADKSVCIQLEERSGKCDDAGPWKLDGERLCYELTWWGATQGEKKACFRISDLGNV